MGSLPSEETLSEVDLHVKSTVLIDAIKLVTKGPSKLAEIEDKYLANTRILPCEDSAH